MQDSAVVTKNWINQVTRIRIAFDFVVVATKVARKRCLCALVFALVQISVFRIAVDAINLTGAKRTVQSEAASIVKTTLHRQSRRSTAKHRVVSAIASISHSAPLAQHATRSCRARITAFERSAVNFVLWRNRNRLHHCCSSNRWSRCDRLRHNLRWSRSLHCWTRSLQVDFDVKSRISA